MNKNISIILAFSLGTAAGYFAAKKTLAHKYELAVKEEVNSVKEALAKYNTRAFEVRDASNDKTAADLQEKVKALGYSGNSTVDEALEKKSIYAIPPEEFGSLYDFETVSLTHYTDGVVPPIRIRLIPIQIIPFANAR